MRLIIAILTLASMLGFACAQNIGGTGGMGGGGGKGRNAAQNTEQQKADQQKKKAAEDAYKAGLKAIPDANEKLAKRPLISANAVRVFRARSATLVEPQIAAFGPAQVQRDLAARGNPGLAIWLNFGVWP
jgi:hypothetical protein